MANASSRNIGQREPSVLCSLQYYWYIAKTHPGFWLQRTEALYKGHDSDLDVFP